MNCPTQISSQNHAFERYRRQLDRIFCSVDLENPYPSTEDIQKILRNAKKKLSPGRDLGGLYLHLSEQCIALISMYCGDMDDDFYELLFDAYTQVMHAAKEDQDLYLLWKSRLDSIQRDIQLFAYDIDERISEDPKFSNPTTTA